MQVSRQALVVLSVVVVFSVFALPRAAAQSVASGTIEGTVADPTGGVVVGATVEMRNPITGFVRTTMTDSMGMFRFTNVPFNPYHIQVTAGGFAAAAQDVTVRTTVTIPVKIDLSVAGVTESVTVEAGAQDILENVPFAHS